MSFFDSQNSKNQWSYSEVFFEYFSKNLKKRGKSRDYWKSINLKFRVKDEVSIFHPGLKCYPYTHLKFWVFLRFEDVITSEFRGEDGVCILRLLPILNQKIVLPNCFWCCNCNSCNSRMCFARNSSRAISGLTVGVDEFSSFGGSSPVTPRKKG